MDFPLMVRGSLVIIDAGNPRYANADHSWINLDLTVADADRGVVQIGFTAVETDTEEHGRLLHAYGESLGPLPYTRTTEEQKQRIADRRWLAETSGLTINGMFVNTEDRSKTLMNGSAIKAMRNPEYVLRWKTPTGFIDLSSEQVLYIAEAVADFVQLCFDREDELVAALIAGTFTDSMLEEGWPSNG